MDNRSSNVDPQFSGHYERRTPDMGTRVFHLGTMEPTLYVTHITREMGADSITYELTP